MGRSSANEHAASSKENKRAMLIGRISDRKQSDGVSLDFQERFLKEYAARAGLEVVDVRSFQESAKRSDLRQHFHQAVADAQAKNVRHLVFYMWDRVARNFTDAELLEDLINEDKVVLHIASENRVLDSASQDSDFFMFSINIAQAKQENRYRRRKTIDGMEERALRGWFPGRTPFGYFNRVAVDENGRIKKRGSTIGGPTDEARRLLRRELELRLQGYSLERIRQTCLAEGVIPEEQRPTYRVATIEKRLKNEFYAAIPEPHDGFVSQFSWRGERYEGKHEPVFTCAEWEALQATFGQRPLYKKVRHEGLFGEGPLRLTCSQCGCLITYAPKQRGDRRHEYYHCANGRGVHEREVNVTEADILAQLARAIDVITVTEGFAAAVMDALNEEHTQAQQVRAREADSCRAALRELETREDRLYDRLDSGELDGEAYKRQRERIRQDREALQQKLSQAEQQVDGRHLVTAQRVLELATKAKSLWNSRSPSKRREMLAELLWNARLDGKVVDFDLRKPFELLSRMSQNEDWRPVAVLYRTESGKPSPTPRRTVAWPGQDGHRPALPRRSISPSRSSPARSRSAA